MFFKKRKIKARDTPRTLIVDADSTFINSVKAVCEVYNSNCIPQFIESIKETSENKEQKDNLMKHFKKELVPADWTKVNTWNIQDQCKLLDDNYSAIDIFASPKFFDVVEFFPHAQEALKQLSEITNIIVCSAGTPMNIALKVLWLDEHLPFADVVPVIHHGSNGVGKKIVNMEGCVFIDDHATNLEQSNAEFKVCYGDKKDWNKNHKGLWMKDWSPESVDNIIDMILDR